MWQRPVQLHSGSWENAEHECATCVTFGPIPVIFIEKNVKINTNSASWVVEGEFLVREAVGTSQKTDWTEVGVTERE